MELEIDRINAVTRNLKEGDQEDKEFERRMKIANTLLKEKAAQGKENANRQRVANDLQRFNAQLLLVRQVEELKSQVEELTNGKRSKVGTRGRKRIQQTEETPNHPTKSHVVVAKDGDKIKTIRFGQQGVKGAGKNPKTAKIKRGEKATTPATTLKTQIPASYLRVIGRIRLNGKHYESTST